MARTGASSNAWVEVFLFCVFLALVAWALVDLL
jgi:hypothetical protein